MANVVVIGAGGQDGQLLSDLLRRRGDRVCGITRGSSWIDTEAQPAVDIRKRDEVAQVIGELRPAELYYLAAYHHSSEDSIPPDDRQVLEASMQVHVDGWANCLEGVKTLSPKTRCFYAASSHVFGRPVTSPQDEQTPLNPICVYGISKVAGMHVARMYREKHGVFAAVGILYNHESPLRRKEFVSQKIVQAVKAIRDGRQKTLYLGDLSAAVDWGYAPDYVEAMTRILAYRLPEDFVVATGETHTVEQFVEAAFSSAGLDWRGRVVEDASLVAKSRRSLVGNSRKIRELTGWRPSVSFEQMVRVLLDANKE